MIFIMKLEIILPHRLRYARAVGNLRSFWVIFQPPTMHRIHSITLELTKYNWVRPVSQHFHR